jgi:hypothetical protein
MYFSTYIPSCRFMTECSLQFHPSKF